jgi:hypothetical protein
MDAKVKEFLDAAKAMEREAFEKKRDEHLISLGLINDEESVLEYSDSYNYNKGFVKYNSKLDKYYRVVKVVPVKVSDEEYEEIKKVSATPAAIHEENIGNGAEEFLGVVNGIILVISIIATVAIFFIATLEEGRGIFFLIGLGILLIGLISWATVKVMLNISNNLHKINSKLK